MRIKINHIIPKSEAQGPGVRYTIWVQGCSIRCPECSNKDTWSFSGGKDIEVNDLVSEILATEGLDGITITGGEPFDQYPAVYKLCSMLFGKISIFITTGYVFDKLPPMGIMKYIDILCSGPFEADKICSGEWKGSSNQEVRFLTELGKKQSLMPVVLKEVFINKNGSAIETGFSV
jgi:anaerobic ribonucleoside-triphosphate reductase activating protein